MLSDELVFSIDANGYHWCDVVVAAFKRGEWAAAERRTCEGSACVCAAQASGSLLPSGALETAGQDFRYARELVTAHSMEQWLQHKGISAKDWTGHLRRELHRARHVPPPSFDALAQRYPLDDAEAARLTLIDAICGGALDDWARSLAARVAANRTSGIVANGNAHHDCDGAVPSAIAHVLGIDADAWSSTSSRIHAVDAAFEGFRSTQVTDQAVETYISARQLEWIRFDCRVMGFPEPDMAAEAAMLLREDNEGFTGVYRAAHTEPRRAHFLLDSIDAGYRDQFLGAQSGDLVGPMREGDEFVLYLVERKTLPSTRDRDIRTLAERGVLEHALKHQLDHHVEWHAVLQ